MNDTTNFVRPSRRPGRRLAVAGCLILVCILATHVAAGWDSSVRPLLSVAFYLGVPGWAIVGWLELEDEVLSWSLAIGSSIAAGILVAEAMLWSGAWNPTNAFWVLAGVSTVSLVAQVVRSIRPRSRTVKWGGASKVALESTADPVGT